MALVACEFRVQPWQLAELNDTRRMWLEEVAIWRAERARERDQHMLEAMARIMGAKR